MTTNALVKEILSAAKEAPRLYFAPLFGALRAVQEEIDRICNTSSDDRHDVTQMKNTDDGNHGIQV